MSVLLPQGKQLYLSTATGLPLVGGKVFTFAAGTNTPKTTWSDPLEAVPNTNPVILDSRGEAVIFWNGNYKIQLKDALDNIIWTVDGCSTGEVLGSADALRTQLASTGDVLLGAAMVGYNPSFDYGQGKVGRALNGYAYGAVADGATDDTTALQAMVNLAAARGMGVDGRGQLYGVNHIRLLNGLKFFRNFRLKVVTPGQQSILELAGYNYGDAPIGAQTVAVGMSIEYNELNCNNIAPMAIFGQGNSDLLIRKNKITGVPNTSSNNCGMQFGSTTFLTGLAPTDIRIVDNDITLPVIAFGGFTIPAIYILGATDPSAANIPATYQSTGNIPRSNPVASNIIIRGNDIKNGYYGVAAQGMDASKIVRNRITGQGARCIQMIDCRDNDVHHNSLLEWNISAINCSFGSWNNDIHHNRAIRVDAASASDNFEGAIQTYVFTRGNRISNNRIKTSGRFGIYIGLDASENKAIANYVEGATLAQIAVEANWINGALPAAALYSRVSSLPQAQQNTYAVQVLENTLAPPVGACGLYLSCLGLAATITTAENILADNKIVGTCAHYLYIVAVNAANASTNAISNTHLLNTTIVNGDISTSRIYINRTGNGRGACSECRGNSIINHLPAHAPFTNNAVTQSVSDADEWAIANSVPTTVTSFTGGMIGQEINIHLSSNVTLQHNANISLKGGVDATVPANPNRPCIQLRYFDRFIEQWRNF